MQIIFGSDENEKTLSNAILALFIAAVLAFSGCSKTDAPSSSEASSASEEASSIASSAPAEDSSSEVSSVSDDSSDVSVPAAGGAELADSWESMEIAINGVVYRPGDMVSDYIASGWEMDAGNEGATLPGNTLSWMYMTSGENKITVSYINENETATPIEECAVTKVKFSTFDFRKGGTFELPGGLTTGSTLEDVQALYGEPTDAYVNKEGIVLNHTYKIPSGEYTISFDDDGVINGAEVWYRD